MTHLEAFAWAITLQSAFHSRWECSRLSSTIFRIVSPGPRPGPVTRAEMESANCTRKRILGELSNSVYVSIVKKFRKFTEIGQSCHEKESSHSTCHRKHSPPLTACNYSLTIHLQTILLCFFSLVPGAYIFCLPHTVLWSSPEWLFFIYKFFCLFVFNK